MKNKFSRLISAILILTFLVSAFSIFASADEGDEEYVAPGSASFLDGSVSPYDVDIYLNRDFDEGWQYNNGLDVSRVYNNNFFVDYEEAVDFSYNYFWRLEAANSGMGKTRVNFYNDNLVKGGLVFEFSIKADDVCNFGTIMELTTASKEQVVPVVAISGGEVIVAPNATTSNEPANCNHPDANGDNVCDYYNPTKGASLGKISNEWLDVAIIFDFDEVNFTATVLYGDNYENSKAISFEYPTAGGGGIRYFDIGFGAASAADSSSRIGMSYCLDNIKFYSGAKKIAFINNKEHGYGQKVNTLAEKVVDIKASDGVKNKNQLIDESLAMKVGVDYALFRNEKVDANALGYGAPVLKVASDGKAHAMIPLGLVLDFIGYPYYVHPDNESYDITTGTSATYIAAGRDSATVNGQRVELIAAPGYVTEDDGSQYLAIAVDDVPAIFPGWLSLYDDMGFIMIYEDVTPDNNNDLPLVTRDADLSKMLDIMKKFVFGFSNENKESNFDAIGESVVSAVKKNTNSFSHPYIMADAETFASLNAAYTSGSDATLKGYLDDVIKVAEDFYKEYATTSGSSYNGISDKLNLQNVYSDGVNPDETNADAVADTTDGYDTFGRFEIIVKNTEILPYLAFAYQVTGNENYARFAYDIQLALSRWMHWGPAYFINCAEATSNYAIAYDWLYNAYVKLFGNEQTEKIASAIYLLGVHDGYVSSYGLPVEHARLKGDSSQYVNRTDNWNVICSSGMIIGALSILDYAETHADVYSEAIYLIGNNFVNLSMNGLDEYAPDGSYIESVKYWEIATTSFVKMVMALTTAADTDYGFMDTWGIDKTCYYACHIESSDGFIWNYHDGGADGVTSGDLTGVNTEIFNFVGTFYGDTTLLSVRKAQLEDGKTAGILDLLAYPGSEIEAKKDLPLSYEFDSLDGFVVRDSWDKGAMYTGIMGGKNDSVNGQIDSGNFIYHNNGIVWFMDLGSENYDVFQYETSSKYKYYRASSEGNNVVFIDNEPDLMYGQYSQTGGTMTNTYTNEYGSYAIIDNTQAYNGKTSLAKRGLLVKDNGKTVVIQDEVYFVDVEELVWVAHTAQNIVVSDDQKTAYLSKGASVIRVSLVSAIDKLLFEVEDTYQRALDATYNKNDSVNNGGQPEYSRNGIQRLIIKAPPLLNCELAVVIEEVREVGDSTPVNYTYERMNMWNPSAPEDGGAGADVERHPAATLTYLRTGASDANSYVRKKTALKSKFTNFYEILSRLAFTIEALGGVQGIIGGSGADSAVVDFYKQYESSRAIYDGYRDFVIGNVETAHNMTLILSGMSAE